MADDLASKLAEAKKKTFGDLESAGGVSVLLVSGQANVESKTPKVTVRKVE